LGPVLEVDRLRVAIGKAVILRDVSLRLAAGEAHGLVGESGAGKSMIGRAILGLLPEAARVVGGAVRYRGRDVLRDPRRLAALLGREIAVIPQDPSVSLNPVRRIGRQMGAVLRRRAGLSEAAARARVLTALAEVLIRDPERVAASYPHQLSGGMRQRVLIATAFATNPALIVADEPTTALDVTVQREILRLIRDLRARHGSAVLFVTHDLGVVAKLCARMTVLHAGRVLEQGAVATILDAPAHPYTRALLAASPRLDRPADGFAPVPAELTAALRAEAERL
jgi:peptide/nickel transport system ATP-binding protein